jgi:hypothetical protein
LTHYLLFVAGPPLIFEYSGHFYELSSFAANWGTAHGNAASRSYRGMRGHLMTIAESREASAVLAFFQVSSFWLAAKTTFDDAWVWTDGPEEDWFISGRLYTEIFAEPNRCVMYTGGSQITSSDCAVARLYVIEYECDLTSSIDDCYGTL